MAGVALRAPSAVGFAVGTCQAQKSHPAEAPTVSKAGRRSSWISVWRMPRSIPGTGFPGMRRGSVSNGRFAAPN